MNKELLRLEQITNYKNNCKSLEDARLNLFEGEVLGIIGVNNAGKTELADGISGARPFSEGRVYVREKAVKIRSIAEGRKEGIYYFSNHSSLISELSIWENFLLGPSRKALVIDKAESEAQCMEMLELLGLSISIHEQVGHLSIKEKLLIEMSRAVYHEARILIFDNILSRLSASALKEFEQIFEMLCTLRIGIILIENSIRYLRRYCERLFVMREGKTAAVLLLNEAEDNFIVSLMLGYKADGELINFLEEPAEGKEVLLEFSDVCYENILLGISFQVFRGEIAGILNVNKNSGRAIQALLQGEGQLDSGVIKLRSKSVRFQTPKEALSNKIAVMADKDCIFPNLSLGENIMLSSLERDSRIGGMVNHAEVKYMAHELMTEYLIPYAGVELHEQELGKDRILMRKLSFCRMLSAEPELVVLSNPTREIDVTTKAVIYDDIRSLKKHQITGIIISSDVKELLAVCDRILVVNNGRADGDLVSSFA